MTLPQDVKTSVSLRAWGRCEYCKLPEREALHPHQIDHIIPRQHGGVDTEDNLALCCVTCNRYKGPNLATLDQETGVLVGFFHPRKHTWETHFRLENGKMIGLTSEGKATVFIFRLNDNVRVEQRQKLTLHGRYPE